jgi:tRNA acetyltransferase TAN1
MLEDFNLLISSSRGEEGDANSELRYLLRELGDKNARTNYTPVSGLTVAKTGLEPVSVIRNMRSLLRASPWKFRYVLKVKPVRNVVPCSIEEITSAVVKQLAMVEEGETFRVSVEKRQNHISSREIIDAVAAKVPRKVDLEYPGKLIMVEIVGNVAGVSVVEPSCVLGVEKEKRIPTSQQPARLSVQ